MTSLSGRCCSIPASTGARLKGVRALTGLSSEIESERWGGGKPQTRGASGESGPNRCGEEALADHRCAVSHQEILELSKAGGGLTCNTASEPDGRWFPAETSDGRAQRREDKAPVCTSSRHTMVEPDPPQHLVLPFTLPWGAGSNAAGTFPRSLARRVGVLVPSGWPCSSPPPHSVSQLDRLISVGCLQTARMVLV